jgi:hypothetical protein
LSGIGAAIDGESFAVIQDVIDSLKPQVRQIPGFYLVDFHFYSHNGDTDERGLPGF